MNTIADLPLDQLRESPFNPRRTFADIDGLAADIASHGRVLQPLLVRPVYSNPLQRTLAHYEIVFGHRRARAARVAGLASVPCMVQELDTEQARRAQISENLQRDDVHPIEEAEGFQALMSEHGVSADQLAEQCGKSRSYVYGRLKLLQACPKVRDACLKGHIGAEVALLIARLRNDKLQAKALQYIGAHNLTLEDGGTRSFRRIRELLAEKFTLDLKRALFDTADALLLPEAGACSACPKRTGNAPEYADLAEGTRDDGWRTAKGSADICTDPDCFDAKKRAHLALKARELEAKGKTVVTGNKARAAISATGELKGDYVPLAKVRDAIKKAKLSPTGAGLKGGAVVPVTIQDPRTGKTVEAVTRAALQAAGVKAAALPKAAPTSGDHAARYRAQEEKYAREREERFAKAKAEQAVRAIVMDQVLAAAAQRDRALFDLQLIARAAYAGVEYHGRELLAQRHGIDPAKVVGFDEKHVDKIIVGMDAAALATFCLECALAGDVTINHNADEPMPALEQAAKHYGVDIKAVRKAQAVAAATPAPARAAQAGKKAAKGKATPKPAPADDGDTGEEFVHDVEGLEA